MRQPATFDRMGQLGDHRILPDQLGKGLRTIFAREHAIELRRRGLGRFAEIEGIGHRMLSRPGNGGCRKATAREGQVDKVYGPAGVAPRPGPGACTSSDATEFRSEEHTTELKSII